MKGKIIQFRRGRHTFHKRHFLIEIPGIDNKEKAKEILGKKVSWESPAGKIIKGYISKPHGNKGVVRGIFEIGLPGQAVNTEVEISEEKKSKNEGKHIQKQNKEKEDKKNGKKDKK